VKDAVLESKPILERFRLEGRVALVTGGGQGIGRAFCHALGEAGVAVAVVDLDAACAEAVAHELSQKGVDAIAVRSDVTDAEQVEQIIRTITGHWGQLTIGVNNAGIGNWADAEKVPRDNWRMVMSLNLDAVLFCAQSEAREMFKRKYGKIINTASMSAHIVNTPQRQVAYNTSKAEVIHMTRTLAAEWADRGIRVNSISPGYTRTMLVEKLIATPEGQKMTQVWMPLIPMKRIADVSDLQGAVVYLASEASDFMTGSDLLIAGGVLHAVGALGLLSASPSSRSLSDEPIEAALIDGVNRMRLHRYMTLPIIRNSIVGLAFLKIVEALRTFDLIYIMTRGGPGVATETIDLYAYNVGIAISDNISYGACISFLMMVITVVFSNFLCKVVSR